MKITRVLLSAFILISIATLKSNASESHRGRSEAEEQSTRFGPGKAVEAFDKEQGFKLSQKAMKSLGVSFSALSGSGPWKIPKEALVRLKQSDGVYRRYDGWISLVLVKVISKENGTLLIRSEDLEPGDDVAVSGAQFLRMTDADLNAGTVDSCAH